MKEFVEVGRSSAGAGCSGGSENWGKIGVSKLKSAGGFWAFEGCYRLSMMN